MKNLLSSLTAAAALAAAFAFAPFAHAGVSSVVAPVPVHAVHPTNLPWQYENMTVTVNMTIDAQGVPHDLVFQDHVPSEVAERVLPALAQWRFTPCFRNGKAVATRVEFPLRIVPGDLHQAPTRDGAALIAHR